MELLYKEESYRIVGACFEVYNQMGAGFLEAGYQECLDVEFGRQQKPYNAQCALVLEYRGCPLKQRYTPDFICYNKIILEIKAVKKLADEHFAHRPSFEHLILTARLN